MNFDEYVKCLEPDRQEAIAEILRTSELSWNDEDPRAHEITLAITIDRVCEIATALLQNQFVQLVGAEAAEALAIATIVSAHLLHGWFPDIFPPADIEDAGAETEEAVGE